MNLKDLREQCVTDKNEFHSPATVLALLDVIEEMRGALEGSCYCGGLEPGSEKGKTK